MRRNPVVARVVADTVATIMLWEMALALVIDMNTITMLHRLRPTCLRRDDRLHRPLLLEAAL